MDTLGLQRGVLNACCLRHLITPINQFVLPCFLPCSYTVVRLLIKNTRECCRGGLLV